MSSLVSFIIAVVFAIWLIYAIAVVLYDGMCEVERRRRNGQD